MVLPDTLAPLAVENSRGSLYAMDDSREGVWRMLKTLYPGGDPGTLTDPKGNTAEYFLRVPPEELAKVRGLKARFDRPVEGKRDLQLPQFPVGLPPGPYRATIRGNLYIATMGRYSFDVEGGIQVRLWIKDKPAEPGYQFLEKGYLPIRFVLDVPAGKLPSLRILRREEGKPGTVRLDASFFDCLPTFRGLKGSYFHAGEWSGNPELVQWDPLLNFTNGNDFSIPPSCNIHWEGTLDITRPGNYRLFPVPGDSALISIEGRMGGSSQKDSGWSGYLSAGPHEINVYYGKLRPGVSECNLMWTPPGGKPEIVPYSAFGKIP